ncbi:MAG: MazG nucleotide pyrophosphohydrolase domain-containing protein [Candidatus Hodarchaeales archaeon]
MTIGTIKEFQNLMKDLYLERDQKRGLDKTLLWLQSEQGELVDAYLKKDLSSIEEEIADVFALLDIDLEQVIWTKYPKICPKCGESPCICPNK